MMQFVYQFLSMGVLATVIIAGVAGLLGAAIDRLINKEEDSKAVIFAIAGGVISAICVNNYVSYLERELPASYRLYANEKAASKIREQAPIKLDDLTTLYDARGDKDGITYYNTLEISYAGAMEITEGNIGEWRDEIKTTVTTSVCADPDTLSYLNDNMEMRYNYTAQNKTPLFVITVKKGDC